jgi:hypothetical protein
MSAPNVGRVRTVSHLALIGLRQRLSLLNFRSGGLSLKSLRSSSFDTCCIGFATIYRNAGRSAAA